MQWCIDLPIMAISTRKMMINAIKFWGIPILWNTHIPSEHHPTCQERPPDLGSSIFGLRWLLYATYTYLEQPANLPGLSPPSSSCPAQYAQSGRTRVATGGAVAGAEWEAKQPNWAESVKTSLGSQEKSWNLEASHVQEFGPSQSGLVIPIWVYLKIRYCTQNLTALIISSYFPYY